MKYCRSLDLVYVPTGFSRRWYRSITQWLVRVCVCALWLSEHHTCTPHTFFGSNCICVYRATLLFAPSHRTYLTVLLLHAYTSGGKHSHSPLIEYRRSFSVRLEQAVLRSLFTYLLYNLLIYLFALSYLFIFPPGLCLSVQLSNTPFAAVTLSALYQLAADDGLCNSPYNMQRHPMRTQAYEGKDAA